MVPSITGVRAVYQLFKGSISVIIIDQQGMIAVHIECHLLRLVVVNIFSYTLSLLLFIHHFSGI